jgi:hypothetical protein
MATLHLSILPYFLESPKEILRESSHREHVPSAALNLCHRPPSSDADLVPPKLPEEL